MRTPDYLLPIVFLLIPFTFYGQAETQFNGINLDQSLELVAKSLKDVSQTTDVISIEHPVFPLATHKEDHLICTNVKTKNGTIPKAVFTFADDQLKYVEARGNVQEVLVHNLKDTARTFMDYDVYLREKLFINKKKDAAWIMVQEAMHANLFAWENPYLKGTDKKIATSDYSKEIPTFLKMGASIDEMRPLLEANGDFTNTEELDGSDPNAQIQINCFGVEYLGFPRKVEARFGDNQLNVVWILTAKGEEDRIRAALTQQFGSPIFVNEDWEIFNNWQVGLRKDKPEVLLMEQQIGLQYKQSYFKE